MAMPSGELGACGGVRAILRGDNAKPASEGDSGEDGSAGHPGVRAIHRTMDGSRKKARISDGWRRRLSHFEGWPFTRGEGPFWHILPKSSCLDDSLPEAKKCPRGVISAFTRVVTDTDTWVLTLTRQTHEAASTSFTSQSRIALIAVHTLCQVSIQWDRRKTKGH